MSGFQADWLNFLVALIGYGIVPAERHRTRSVLLGLAMAVWVSAVGLRLIALVWRGMS